MGRRPALALSYATFSRATGMAIVCPVTSTDRHIPFHVALPAGVGVEGFVMVEQVKAIDHRARRWRRIGRLPVVTLDENLAILDACLE